MTDIAIHPLLENIVEIALGVVLAAYAAETMVKRYVENATKGISLVPPSGIDQRDWNHVLERAAGGKWLGRLERLLSLLAFWNEAYVLLGGWLTFKLASKWEIWKNLVRVPDRIGDTTVGDLKARSSWGGFILVRFLVGTLANILAGAASAYVARNFVEVFR